MKLFIIAGFLMISGVNAHALTFSNCYHQYGGKIIKDMGAGKGPLTIDFSKMPKQLTWKEGKGGAFGEKTIDFGLLNDSSKKTECKLSRTRGIDCVDNICKHMQEIDRFKKIMSSQDGQRLLACVSTILSQYQVGLMEKNLEFLNRKGSSKQLPPGAWSKKQWQKASKGASPPVDAWTLEQWQKASKGARLPADAWTKEQLQKSVDGAR